MRIDRVDTRSKLKPRRDPHWHRLVEGRHLGYRRMTASTAGTWLARYRDGERYDYATLGTFADRDEKDRYAAAKAAAEEWFKHRDLGGVAKSGNVRAACEAFIEDRRMKKSDATADDAEARFERLVYRDPIARIELSRLSKNHCAEWAKRAMKAAKASSTSRHAESWRGSYNRNVTAFRAALYLAHEQGKVATPNAWQSTLKPMEDRPEDRRREQYLGRDDRRKLIENASDEAQPFLKALALLPMRPGEVAALKVEHLNVEKGVLQVPTGKTKSRTLDLSGEALAHFKQCARNKLPGAWLIARANGTQWKKEAWRDEVKLAAAGAKLPRATVAYAIRHSAITDLVTGGDVDLLTIANLAGTSVQMIQDHYWKRQASAGKRALEKLALA